MMIAFLGFGGGYYSSEYLQEGEWASGTIELREEMEFGTAFIMPVSGILRNIQVLFATASSMFFEPGIVIRPFVCLALAFGDSPVYTILQQTMTFTEPYVGGVEYPRNTINRGLLSGLDIPITEGALVAILAGFMSENAPGEEFGTFAISGGLYIQ